MLIKILSFHTFSITYFEAGGEEITTWSTEVIQIFWLATKFLVALWNRILRFWQSQLGT
jgi:hypothetical protein